MDYYRIVINGKYTRDIYEDTSYKAIRRMLELQDFLGLEEEIETLTLKKMKA
jgi:hypothetical protein